MEEDAAPGEMHVSCSGATLAPRHPKDYVVVRCQLSQWPLELISHADDATDTCFEQSAANGHSKGRTRTPRWAGMFKGTECLATPLGAEIYPPALALLDQTLSKHLVLPAPQASSNPVPAEPQASPHPHPATPQLPHLGSVLRTKGWLLVQRSVDPRTSS